MMLQSGLDPLTRIRKGEVPGKPPPMRWWALGTARSSLAELFAVSFVRLISSHLQHRRLHHNTPINPKDTTTLQRILEDEQVINDNS